MRCIKFFSIVMLSSSSGGTDLAVGLKVAITSIFVLYVSLCVHVCLCVCMCVSLCPRIYVRMRVIVDACM